METATSERSTSVFTALLDIFVAPGKALRGARAHIHWLWVPLGTLLAVMAVFWSFYYLTVDFAWLAEQLIAPQAAQMSAEQREQTLAFMNPGFLIASTLITALVFVFLINALIALYLFIIAKVTGDEENGYGRWFAASVWSGFPGVLSILGMALNYALAQGNQMTQQELSVTNLNALLFHFPMQHPWAGFTAALDLTAFWQIALLALSVSIFTGRGYGKSLWIAAAPYLLVFGTWAVIIIL